MKCPFAIRVHTPVVSPVWAANACWLGVYPHCCYGCRTGGDGEHAVMLLQKHEEMVHSPAASGVLGRGMWGRH